MKELEISNGSLGVKAATDDRLDTLLQLIESGEVKSLKDLQDRLESPVEKELVKCASLLRCFDETIYTEALQLFPPVGVPRISFSEFTRNPDIEHVPRTEKVFRVKDEVRQNYLNQWQSDLSAPDHPDFAAADWFKILLSHFQGDGHELDLLALLILSDPERAKDMFLTLFEGADTNFDLARCHDILKTLEDRYRLLSPELSKLCVSRRQYLNARTLFAPEYYQTVFYYGRESIVDAFDELLKVTSTHSKQWIFHLYAMGGMGKTMFVRWLIARHCVPAQRAIPVARLDFDFLHLPTVGRYPWLLILSIAHQLNQQIDGSPFNEHLQSYWQYISLLRPPNEMPVDDSRLEKERLLQANEEQVRDTIVNRFIDALVEVKFQRPLVVVLDTLEVMTLYHKRTLIAILRQLRVIHDGYGQMRLLLSGRYNLQEPHRLTEFRNQFKDETIVHELPPFSRDDARYYLSKIRGLADEDDDDMEEIVEAIITRCEIKQKDGKIIGSNPFKLSLFADLYQQEEIKTVDEVRSYPRTDFAYLINRVIKRIKEPTVQWLLRYAVIPRRFTFEIFEKVVAHHLEEELIRERKLDLVNQNFPKEAASFEGQKNWKEPKAKRAKSLNIRAIWNHLRKYASNYSFISFDAGDETAPHLQPDVVVPMRLLLEKQSIFKPLHEDAAAHFERKAKAERDPKLWAEYICEAIYHHFQRDGSAAVSFWRKQLDSVEAQRDLIVRKMISAELLGSDYVTEDRLPIKRDDGQLMVNPEDLYEAYCRNVEACVASTVRLSQLERSAAWATIAERLDAIEQLGKGRTFEPTDYQEPFDTRVLLRLARAMRETRAKDKTILPLLGQAIESTTSEQMILSLEIQRAEAMARMKHAGASSHFMRAQKLSRRTEYPHVQSCEIHLKIAKWYHENENYARAEQQYRMALRAAKNEKNSRIARDVTRALAHLNLDIRLYDKAIALIERAKQMAGTADKSDQLKDDLNLSQIQVRALLDPLRALSIIEPYLKNQEDAQTIRERAAITEVHGDVIGQLMEFDQALLELEHAKGHWTAAADPFGTDRTRMLRIELQLFDIGNLNEAAYLLDVWEKTGTKSNIELTSHLEILRVQLAHRSGDIQEARNLWRKSKRHPQIQTSPRAYTRVLAAGLALNIGNASTVKEFIANLRKVQPMSARPALLDSFQHALSSFEAKPADRRAIKRLLNIKSKGKDIIPHALQRADVLGRCGETTEAKKILDRAGREALRQKNSFAYRLIILAKARLDLLGDDEALSASNFLVDFAKHPNLCCAACIEQAEWHLKQGNIAQAKESFALANTYSTNTGNTTQWQARLSELSGELSRVDGNIDAARDSFNAALSIYEKLGNKPAVERLRRLLPSVANRGSKSGELLTTRIITTTRTIAVESYVGEELETTRSFASSKGFPIAEILADIKDKSAIYSFAKRYLKEPEKVRVEIGRILLSNKLVARLKKADWDDSCVDFRLDSMSPSLAKIPWELAEINGRATATLFRHFYRSTSYTSRSLEVTRWLQVALQHLIDPTLIADGVFSSKTQFALNLLKQEFNLPLELSGSELYTRIGELLSLRKYERKPRALLITARHEEQIRNVRGPVFSNPSVNWAYRNSTFDVEMLHPHRIDSLREYLEKFRPDLIHIQSSFRETQTAGEIYLDFGNGGLWPSDRSSSRSAACSPAFLNDSLALLPSTKLRPLVVLDAVCPPGATEIIHQLLYRNAFAAELFQLGNTSGVIAIGLTPDGELQRILAEKLISGLYNKQAYGKIVNSLRSSSRLFRVDPIATLGIAVFTNEPSLTILSDM